MWQPNNSENEILVIEDEIDIARLIQLHLNDHHFSVELRHDGIEGLKRAQEKSWSLIILDLRLPSMDGLDICRQLRANASYVPILMLTSRSTELDRVLGLEIGADDYLTKPFSIVELVARVKALLRRAQQHLSQTPAQPDTLTTRGLTLNRIERTTMLENRQVELTAKEFDLLWYFVSHPNRVFNRLELLEEVWGYGHRGYEHTVNSHINRLRGKIESDPANPALIRTVWGVGYQFSDKEQPDESKPK